MNWWLPILLAAVMALSSWIGELPTARRVQRTSGNDVLSVAFGDAKVTIGRAMIQKADSYFHGGVDDHGAQRRHSSFDPWRWINERVQAPHVHRHLEGERAVELIPWLWAAVKANPRDTDAWTSAWYIAGRQMKNWPLACRIAAEGMRQNPQALDIACVLARGFKECDPQQAEAQFRSARKLAIEKCGGRLSRLDERDGEAFLEILNYLSTYESDKAALQRLLNEARQVNPRHAVVDHLERLL